VRSSWARQQCGLLGRQRGLSPNNSKTPYNHGGPIEAESDRGGGAQDGYYRETGGMGGSVNGGDGAKPSGTVLWTATPDAIYCEDFERSATRAP
jgi:hypothetical protein